MDFKFCTLLAICNILGLAFCNNRSVQDYDVVIVGAGLAGLGMTHKFHPFLKKPIQQLIDIDSNYLDISSVYI